MLKMFKRELDLKDDVIVDGKRYLLSTVDLMIEHIGGKFETMLFGYKGNEINLSELYCNRYYNKQAAIAGHNELLERLQNGEKIWE